jgi:hypothetical protein
VKSPLLVIDTLDDRREVWSLLHRLPPRERLCYLRWCCAQVSDPVTGNGPTPLIAGETVRMAYRCDRADTRLTNEVYGCYLSLVGQHSAISRRSLDPVVAAVELERVVREFSRG